MARPVVSELSEQMYAALGWHTEADEDNDWALLKFVAAWVETLLDPVYQFEAEDEEGNTPWSLLLDPDNCPASALPYLAQYVGVEVVPEQTEEQLRKEIKEPTGWARGRINAVKVAAGRGLTGTQLVIVKPRTPEVGMHYVRTLLSETPDPARTETTIRAAIPAWEQLDYEAFVGMTWADVIAKYATWADVIAEVPTWQDLLEQTP